jgi:hypothetical protein
LQLAQWFLRRRFLCEFPIGSYVKQKGGWNLKKILFETTEPISTKLYWNDPWVVPFQIYVWHFRPPTKMATTTELNNKAVLAIWRNFYF